MRMETPPRRWHSGSKGFAMVKVSIIVPVHNSKSYLHKCVESLLAQTLPEIEIILVDDCSTDDSPEMIRRYEGLFPGKIRGLYLPENIRQGGARNRGMEIAKGEYIAFVDSDDFVEPDMCRVLYEAANGADMCGADYYVDDGKSLKTFVVDYGGTEELTDDQKAWFAQHCGYFWSRIYRKDFLDKFHLRFPEGTFFEDAHFNFFSILYARTAVKAEGKYYHYYQSPNSTIRNRNNPRQYERIGIPELLIRDSKARGIYERYRDLIDWNYASMQASNIRFTCLGLFDKPDISQLKRIQKGIKTDCPRFWKSSNYKTITPALRIYLRLTAISPRMALLAYKLDWAVDLLAVLVWKLERRKKS